MNRLRTRLPGLDLKNPIITASGTYGFGQEYRPFYDPSILGALTVKSITPLKRLGNPTPRVSEVEGGMLNAIGLQNPGLDHVLAHELKALEGLKVPILANVAGFSEEDYLNVCKVLHQAPAVSAIELNVSCPNVAHEGRTFGTDAGLIRSLTQAVKSITPLPVYVKLSPNVTDIVAMAQAAIEGGADGLTMINTLIGMRIDLRTGRPILANKTGGLSGPAIKPVAIRMVYEVAQAMDVPIIGMGGLSSVDDVLEMLMAGARAVAIGTANFVNPQVCAELIEALPQRMDELGIASVEDLIEKVKENRR
jgi:dihydroorotate dehydrogenase (NAD+) catalytic subunit